MFSFGCILFYSITGGDHPFGKEEKKIITRIYTNKFDLSSLNDLPEAKDLVNNLLNPDPTKRKTTTEVLLHPVFWDGDMKCSFLVDASNEAGINGAIMTAIAPISNYVPLPWNKNLDVKHFNYMSKIKSYDRNTVDSDNGLLRFIRNTVAHHAESVPHSQRDIGDCEKLDDYFSREFPELLMEVYNAISQHVSQNPPFKKYFKPKGI